MGRPEPSHELGVVGAAAQGDSGQAQRRRPALGSLGELLDLGRRELDGGRAQELAGFGRREAEVLRADFQELSPRTQPGQRERRIGARGDRQPGPRGEPLDEGRDKPVDGGLTDHVVVVEHQHRPAGRPIPRGLLDQGDDTGQGELRIERLAGVTSGHTLGRAPQLCRRSLEVAGEAGDVVVARIERQPRAADVRLGDPGGEQGALAEAGRRRDEHETSLRHALEPGAQPFAIDRARDPRLDAELRREKGIWSWLWHRDRGLPAGTREMNRAQRVSAGSMASDSAVRREFSRPRVPAGSAPESTPRLHPGMDVRVGG